MALVPSPASAFTAVYVTHEKTLRIRAHGEIPSVVLSFWLEREEHFVGGLKFRLLGLYGGLGPQSTSLKPFDTCIEMRTCLPSPYFWSKSVMIQTASGDFPIPIRYDGLGPGYGSAEPAPTITKTEINEPSAQVCTPINIYLTGADEARISVTIPSAQPFHSVRVTFDETHLRLWGAEIQDGSIIYRVKWEKLPEPLTTPVDFDVITSIFSSPIGNSAGSFGKIQPYNFHFVLKDGDKA